MDKKQQAWWKMTANQFAAFDTQLYLDTHPDNAAALQMFDNYRKAHTQYQKEYEALYGPVSSDGLAGGAWDWVKDPWSWEREAN